MVSELEKRNWLTVPDVAERLGVTPARVRRLIEEGAVNWLLSDEDSLGTAPIDALRAGRKAEVRRVAQALAF
jgi:Rv2175c C-terminal domain of unknown function